MSRRCKMGEFDRVSKYESEALYRSSKTRMRRSLQGNNREYTWIDCKN